MGLEPGSRRPAASTALSFDSFILPHEAGSPVLCYGHAGPEDGPVLLLLHGYTDSSLSFRRLIECLPHNLRLIVPDQRGHGGSDKNLNSHRRRDFAADALALLDHLGISRQVVVVGHSLGTLTALRLAVEHPQRVAGLVLIGAAAGASENGVLLELRQALAGLEQAPDQDFIRDFQTSTSAKPLPEEFLEAVIGESARLPLQVWLQALDDLLDGAEDVAVASIQAPTRLIWGEQDGVFSRQDQQQLLAAISGADLRSYAEVGHAPHWEAPHKVAGDLLDFLQGVGWV